MTEPTDNQEPEAMAPPPPSPEVHQWALGAAQDMAGEVLKLKSQGAAHQRQIGQLGAALARSQAREHQLDKIAAAQLGLLRVLMEPETMALYALGNQEGAKE